MRHFKKGPDGRYSDADIERIIEETVAEQRLEGLDMTEAEIGKLRDLLHGRITEADYDAWVAANADGAA